MSDTALYELAPLLRCKYFVVVVGNLLEIVVKKCPDVTVALRKFRDQMIAQMKQGV